MTSLDGINGKSIQRLLKSTSSPGRFSLALGAEKRPGDEVVLKFKLGIYHQGLQMLTQSFKKEGQYSFLFQLKTPCGEGKKIPRQSTLQWGGGGGEVLPYISCRGVCANPKSMVFYTILVWNRVWFSRKLQECMNILIVSIPWPNE